MDVTVYLSTQLIGVLIWIFILSIAEEKEDVIYYFLLSALGLPFGIYLLYNMISMFDIFLGVIVLLISVYSSFLAICYSFHIETRFTGNRKKV